MPNLANAMVWQLSTQPRNQPVGCRMLFPRLICRYDANFPSLFTVSVGLIIASASVTASDPSSSLSGNSAIASGPGELGPNGAKKATERLREGTRLIDTPGTFVSLGADSVTFSPSGSKDAYRVLENLALQRISQQLDENRGPRQWIVSGLITEFRGSNYLLVSKAIVQLQEGDSATDR